MGDFKSTPVMYCIAGAIILFVLAQSVFFLVKAYKHGKKIGLSKEKLNGTITGSALFTVAPALAILATVISLAGALGLVVPWVRLSVIGNITYEATAAQAAMEALGHAGGMSAEVTNKEAFGAIIWVMTVGSVFPLVLLPFAAKPLLNKLSKVTSKAKSNLPDILASAAFIGLIGAFIARAIAGSGDPEIFGDGAGVLSIITLVSSIVIALVLEYICKRYDIKWLRNFVMPFAMLAGMGIAIIAYRLLPVNIAEFEWRG